MKLGIQNKEKKIGWFAYYLVKIVYPGLKIILILCFKMLENFHLYAYYSPHNHVHVSLSHPRWFHFGTNTFFTGLNTMGWNN